MPTILTIDTNIWAFYFDRSLPEHKYVAKAVDNAVRTDEIVINTVILMEISHFLVRNLGPVEGKEKLGSFLGFPIRILEFDYPDALAAIEELSRYSHFGIGGRDATILSFMRRLESKNIMTHDGALKKIDWLKVLDPIPNKV